MAARASHCLTVVVSLAAVLCFRVGPSAATDPVFVAAMRGAAEGFRPTTKQDVDEARLRLRRAAESLTRYLDRQGERGKQWRKYLKCDDLWDQLDRVAPDVQVLQRVLSRFAADHCGLELPHCCDVRRALQCYLRTLQDAVDDDLASQYAARLASLLTCVEDQQLDDAQRREAIGRELPWFVAHEQAVTLTSAVRSRYRAPNLLVSVSGEFVNQALAREIEEAMPIRQMQGRTSIRGRVRVQGNVQAMLIDSEHEAAIDVVFVGNMFARMNGSRGPVTVAAQGDADIAATKRLLLSESGFLAHRATTVIGLRTRLTGASTRFRSRLLDRSISRLALRVARREKGASDAQAARDARRLISSRLDEEVQVLAGELQAKYFDVYRNPLLRRDAFPEQLQLRTKQGRLHVEVLQAAAGQLGAPNHNSLPIVQPQGDVTLRLHESFVENLAETVFAGRTMTETELRDEFQRLTGSPRHAGSQSTIDVDEVAITFPERRPVTLRIREQIVALTVHGARYISGSRAYPPMNVTVRYALSRVGDDYLATMVGEPEIVPPRFLAAAGPHRYSGREAALRRLLVNRLEQHLEKQIEADRLTLPQPVGEVFDLFVRQLDAVDGWFTAALDLGPRHDDGYQAHYTSRRLTSR